MGLDDDLLNEAAKLTEADLIDLKRPGFNVVFYETLEEFYLAEALEYIHAWRQATREQPAGILRTQEKMKNAIDFIQHE
ncbi:MAG: hypothetical protein H6570_09015 [Lewinellaceae bacterium]|nr:hypothetical protein [Lewinellaceae bacterium]